MQTRHLSTRSFSSARTIGSDRRWIMTLLLPAFLLGACSDDTASPAGIGGAGAGGMASAGTGGSGAAGTGGSGTAGTGGSGTGGSGTAGTGGMGGITDNPEFGFKVLCPAPAQALILDFTPAGGSPGVDAGAADAGADAGAPPVRDTTFGNFGTTFAGGTYSYPADGTWPIASDVAQGNWHLSGNVGTFSGFGLYIGGCNVLDASTYDGISFTISGSVAMGNAITLNVNTSANEVSHVWLNTRQPPPPTTAAVNSGRCIPSGNQFDGSCAPPTFSVPVTAQPTTVTVLWAQLTSGYPSLTVNPSEITGISWSFPVPPGAGDPVNAMPYPMDIVIDNIRFVDNP